MKTLGQQLIEIESYIPDLQKQNAKISAVSVGWHLSHMLKVIITICDALKNSNPANYEAEFNFSRTIVMSLKWIPRKAGKAPKVVRPDAELSEKIINHQLEEACEAIKSLNKLSPNSYFSHPYFKDMRLNSAKRFMRIHTQHHLKIVKAILQD